jgi:hypothetical protein
MKFSFSSEKNKFSVNVTSEKQTEIFDFADELFSTDFQFQKLSYSPNKIEVTFSDK